MTTPLDALAEALRRVPKIRQRAEAPSEAILWCDLGSEFAPILLALRARLPNLLSLGAYELSTCTGLALWLRAAAARQFFGLSFAVLFFRGRHHLVDGYEVALPLEHQTIAST